MVCKIYSAVAMIKFHVHGSGCLERTYNISCSMIVSTGQSMFVNYVAIRETAYIAQDHNLFLERQDFFSTWKLYDCLQSMKTK